VCVCVCVCVCVSHHQAYLLPGGQPLQELAAQLVAQDAGLTQAALQGLLVLLAGVRAAPRRLEDVVDDAHDVLPQAAVEAQHHAVVLQLHLGGKRRESGNQGIRGKDGESNHRFVRHWNPRGTSEHLAFSIFGNEKLNAATVCLCFCIVDCFTSIWALSRQFYPKMSLDKQVWGWATEEYLQVDSVAIGAQTQHLSAGS